MRKQHTINKTKNKEIGLFGIIGKAVHQNKQSVWSYICRYWLGKPKNKEDKQNIKSLDNK